MAVSWKLEISSRVDGAWESGAHTNYGGGGYIRAHLCLIVCFLDPHVFAQHKQLFPPQKQNYLFPKKIIWKKCVQCSQLRIYLLFKGICILVMLADIEDN
jgi:hypothetical protein